MGGIFLMISCSINKSIYLKGNHANWNNNMHQFQSQGINYSDNLSRQQKVISNNKTARYSLKATEITNVKRLNKTFVSTTEKVEKRQQQKIIQKKEIGSYNVGDSVKVELFSGKIYFGEIVKIEEDGYFIEIKNKRKIYISESEIKQFTIIKKGQVENAKIKLHESEEVVSSNNNKVNNATSNISRVALKVLKIIGKIALTILGVFAILILILIIAFS